MHEIPEWLKKCLIILLVIEFIYTLPTLYPLWLILGIWLSLGYILDKREQKEKIYNPPPPPNPNPYTLSELQNHLDAYRQKAISSGGRDKWKYGRDYERYVGYLWEKRGWRVTYNGAIEGKFDGGIDLICYKGNEICLVQCKRWKNNVGAEYIERFSSVVKKF